ncbi:hypothetical protein BT96DRAFT_960100 [Gymnopus androsaceus JB14]|uniref:DDE Tnp4 domain-containing protein n=1 Tax=Gymnopus androsaceus JB14 TaxID=1447944 RepID=A0A6A4GTJ9_9AGAR|nr:hypothetical protein BT96DRAFT_960100 [Gymnopus androsaceus JB14]
MEKFEKTNRKQPPDEYVIAGFLFYPEEIVELLSALRIPDPFVTRTRSCFPKIEALGLLLAHFQSAGDMYDLTSCYNLSQSAISELVNELTKYLDNTWKHLLDLGPRNPTRQTFNGYKAVHALKFQALKVPNGMICQLHGPVEGHQNDNHLLATSGVLEWCRANAFCPGANNDTPICKHYFQVFGDPAYGISPVILSPFAGAGQQTKEEKDWNAAMSKVRIEVEHGCADVVQSWPFRDTWWKLQVYSSPVGQYYCVGVLLSNCCNCIRPNQTALTLDCYPPTLEEYLQL